MTIVWFSKWNLSSMQRFLIGLGKTREWDSRENIISGCALWSFKALWNVSAWLPLTSEETRMFMWVERDLHNDDVSYFYNLLNPPDHDNDMVNDWDLMMVPMAGATTVLSFSLSLIGAIMISVFITDFNFLLMWQATILMRLSRIIS